MTDPADPDVAAWHRLLARVFANPDFVLPLEHLHGFLRTGRRPDWVGHCLALKAAGRVAGGSLFRYLPATNCAFSGYLFLDPDLRQHGYGRRIVEERRRMLQADARAHGHDDLDALFIDVVAPDRMAPEAYARERRTMDPRERRVFMARMGFHKLDMPFFQLPLGEGQHEVPWVDLLCLPVRPDWAAAGAVPGDVILATLSDLWQWHPQPGQYLDRLRAAIGGRPVALLPA